MVCSTPLAFLQVLCYDATRRSKECATRIWMFTERLQVPAKTTAQKFGASKSSLGNTVVELPQRKVEDRFLPAGRYRSLQQSLRTNSKLAQVRSLVVSAFDRRTRMLPFVIIDWYMVPCGPRSVAAALYEAGLQKTRLVYQLWNPKIQPARAEIDGAKIDMLLVSGMKVHSAASYHLIEDAWSLAKARPLIIVGGPKACYEPFDYFGLGPDGHIGADVVVTGEEPILLELLSVLADFGGGQGTMLAAFNRARQAGALSEIPGLVYPLDPRHDGKNLINTGPQRLMRDLDDLPMPSSGFRSLEGPHREVSLARKPMGLENACRGQMIATILVTRGCKFHCHYCPVPAYNQRSFRHKSPQRVVEEFIDCHRNMNTRHFFGADDNFFNSSKYTRQLLETMASTQVDGRPLGRRIRFRTESTVIDLYKNRDILPLARKAGLAGVWMGVEDLSAILVDKGQAPDITKVLFAAMTANKIRPMAMIMHHEGQPLHSARQLRGLIDQVQFLFNAGAVGLQICIAFPMVGSKWANEAFTTGMVYERVGKRKLDDADHDGNHVVASGRPDAEAWRTQVNQLRGYAAFYNPQNLLGTLLARWRPLGLVRVRHQVWGMIALARTAWKLKGHIWRLWRGPIQRSSGWPEKFRRPGSPYPDLVQSPDPGPPETRAPR